MRLGGPQSWSGRVTKISSPLAFDPLTFQPVTSRYTECAMPANTHKQQTVKQMCLFIVHLHYKIHMSKSNNMLQSPLHRKLKRNNRMLLCYSLTFNRRVYFKNRNFLSNIYYHASYEGPILGIAHISPPYSHY